MAEAQAAIRNIVTESLQKAFGDGPEKDETETDETAAAAAEVVTEEVKPDPDATGEKKDESTEAIGESTGTADEPPTDYFGVDLTGLSTDERRAIIDGYAERDKFIQQLLRDKAAAKKEGVGAAESETPTTDGGEASDADILAALGIDPDDPYSEQTAKVALPLAKLVLSLNEKVDAFGNQATLESTRSYWEQGLTALEKEFGTLPLSHEDVMREAATASIAEPVDAYWRIMGPGRQAVMAEVTKRRAAAAEALKKATKGTARPDGEVDAGDKGVMDAKDTKEAVKMAFARIAKERGMALSDS